MGLDMNLYRKRYVKNWSHMEDEDKHYMTLRKGNKEIDTTDVAFVTWEVAYWRKANAIHNWFVTNCNGGEDNNGSMYVYTEQLQELLETIDKVLNSVRLKKGKIHVGTTYKDGKSEEMYEDGKVVANPEVCEKYLPTASGFFFGNTDYHEYYIEELKRTRDILAEELSNPDNQYCDYEYVASW